MKRTQREEKMWEKIFYVMGKGTQGKDTIYKLYNRMLLELNKTVTCIPPDPYRLGGTMGWAFLCMDLSDSVRKRYGILIEYTHTYYLCRPMGILHCDGDGQINLQQATVLYQLWALWNPTPREDACAYYGRSRPSHLLFM